MPTKRKTPTAVKRSPKVLVIDVGGSHVKVYGEGRGQALKLDSGPNMTPEEMVSAVTTATQRWDFDVVSIGYPAPVVHGKPLREPYNLGSGWVGFDFHRAFAKPVKVINDAAMQALGSYRGGRMLFLGLGTGLGSTMIVDDFIEPMELAHLPYKKGKTYEEFVGDAARKKLGRKKWTKKVLEIIEDLRNALQPEYVVLGGGNADRLPALPAATVLGNNLNAREGGRRLWHALPRSH